MGSSTAADVVINSAGPVTVAIEARNIPLGTTVRLHFVSENGADILATTTPLAGTLAQSTATAQVTLPSGYSRMFVRATWTP